MWCTDGQPAIATPRRATLRKRLVDVLTACGILPSDDAHEAETGGTLRASVVPPRQFLFAENDRNSLTNGGMTNSPRARHTVTHADKAGVRLNSGLAFFGPWSLSFVHSVRHPRIVSNRHCAERALDRLFEIVLERDRLIPVLVRNSHF